MTTKPSAKRGQISLIIIGAVVMLALAGLTGLVLRNGSSEARAHSVDAFNVRRGSFDISIPVSGELAALKQIEIRNNLDSRAVITEIIPEGTFVQVGDVLLRLNDDEIRTELREEQDRVNVAEAELIAAQSDLEIKIKTREAELAKADLAIKLADLALKAWQEGEAVTMLQELELAVKTAEKEFIRLDERFKESAKLLEQNFISKDEYKRDEIAMMQADSDLKKAINALEVYRKYQFEQEKAQKESDLEQAVSERERVEQQHDAEVRSAQSDVESKKFKLNIAKEELAELQQQLAHCTVTAPAPGLVVYHASTDRGGGRNDGRPPMVGTELSPNEPVIILPDTSQMVAAVKISEALVGQIQKNQRATVTCDAMPDRVLNGRVLSVGVMAETGGWRDPNRRDYTVRILLNEGTEYGLKPSMRCKANIYVGRVSNALFVPIQSIFRNGPLTYVYVPQGSGYAQQKVVTGRSSELYVEITDGLDEGQLVLLRQPQPEEIVYRLPVPKNQQRDLDELAEEEAIGLPEAPVQASPQMMQGGPGGNGPSRSGGPRPGGAGEGDQDRRPDGMRRRNGGPDNRDGDGDRERGDVRDGTGDRDHARNTEPQQPARSRPDENRSGDNNRTGSQPTTTGSDDKKSDAESSATSSTSHSQQ